ncbi:MAG: GNAT family N-acetyltransferase [Thaumarchaeota archaeon]|nr:MAG: GNAT family N-acetyltransferase [Nitrososphaerota archaeon]
MIPTIEENDLGFTDLWCKRIQLECGTVFINQELPNDIFFDKLTKITCTSEKMLNEAASLFHKYGMRPFVYCLDYPELEDLLRRKNFILYDIQHVLVKKTLPVTKPEVHKISQGDSMLWAKIFCQAYDCPEWLYVVDGIVKNSLKSADYIVDESNSSCMALYQKNLVMGLYCLGTVPARRNQGFASSLIDFALQEVGQRKLEFLMLETYEKDNLLDFYVKLGFEKLYQKSIYTI